MGDQSLQQVSCVRVSRQAVEAAMYRVNHEGHTTPVAEQINSGQWYETLVANPDATTFFIDGDGRLVNRPTTENVFDLDQGKEYSAKSMGFDL